jgi:hypothetical protein
LKPVKRTFKPGLLDTQLSRYKVDWIRLGCISDPSLDWEGLEPILLLLAKHKKTPVIVTKIYEPIPDSTFKVMKKSQSILQVSTSGLAPKRWSKTRLDTIERARDLGIFSSSRINSAAFKENSRPWVLQENLISWAEENQIPILETPIRTFKTSPIWKLLDQDKYHKHLSPISGNYDCQSTAGLMINGAYPCFSSCSEFPTKTDRTGCRNQCLTRIEALESKIHGK